jgi:hypothetical protein
MNSETAQEIRDLWRGGLTVREIAKRVGKSYQWVSRVTHEMDKPQLLVSIEGETVVVRGDMDARLLATRVYKALSRTGNVTYEREPTRGMLGD